VGQYGREVVNTIWLCPGQGAQKVGMGKDLAERFPEARDTFAAIDDALGGDAPLSHVMFTGPDNALTATQNAQPAILAHSAAVYAVVREKLHAVAAAGHSLGEYSAYVTAGALTAPDAAKLVRRRGELMQKAGDERPGTMAAVLGLATKDVEAACAEASQQASVAVAANINAPDQTVISGDPDAVTRAGEVCKKKGAKRVIPLKVSGAFHSPLMRPAADGLREALAEADLTPPAFPVYSNVTEQQVTNPADAQRLLVEQLTSPVRWAGEVRNLAAAYPDALFVEMGPGNVLTGLVKRIAPTVKTAACGTSKDVEQLLGVVAR